LEPPRRKGRQESSAVSCFETKIKAFLLAPRAFTIKFIAVFEKKSTSNGRKEK